MVVKAKVVVKVKVVARDKVKVVVKVATKVTKATNRTIKVVVGVVVCAERTAAHLIHACRQDNFHADKAITVRAIL